MEATKIVSEADPFAQFKAAQREGWSFFAPLEAITTASAARLVCFAEVKAGEKVLDVGCGTGVVAITAARAGARVTGLDLTPALLDKGKQNADLTGLAIEFVEGDAENLPFKDTSFDAVLSQFGHMFAPRPAVAGAEMLRVLRPGGRIAFSTWPPELFTGRMFALVAQYLPTPAGAAPPPQWGEPGIVRERLGDAVRDLTFERELMLTPGLSPRHLVKMFEETAGPLVKLAQNLRDDPTRLNEFRSAFQQLIETYYRDNQLHQHYLMTRAVKK